MREMAPNGFPLSIGSAAVMLYIKPGLYGRMPAVQYAIHLVLQQQPHCKIYNSRGTQYTLTKLNCLCGCAHKSSLLNCGYVLYGFSSGFFHFPVKRVDFFLTQIDGQMVLYAVWIVKPCEANCDLELYK